MRSGDGLEVLCQYGIKKQFSVEGVKREINKVQSGGNWKASQTCASTVAERVTSKRAMRVHHVMATPYTSSTDAD